MTRPMFSALNSDWQSRALAALSGAAVFAGAALPAFAGTGPAIGRQASEAPVLQSLQMKRAGGMLALEVSGSDHLAARVHPGRHANSLDLDIPGKPLFAPAARKVGYSGIADVHYGWYQARPPVLRVVVDGAAPLLWKVENGSGALRILVWTKRARTAQNTIALKTPLRAAPAPLLTHVTAPNRRPPVALAANTLRGMKSPTTGGTALANAIASGDAVIFHPTLVDSVTPALGFDDAGSRRRTSLNVTGANLVDVLKALAEQTGTNIVITSGVSGTVTIKLRNVTADTALQLITGLNHLSFARTAGNTIVVGTDEQIKDLFQRKVGPTLVSLTRANPAEVAAAIGKNYPGVVAVPQGGNELLVSGREDDVKAAEGLIGTLDGVTPPPAVSPSPTLVTLLVSSATDIAGTVTKLYPKLTVMTEGPRQVLLNGDPGDLQNALSLIKNIDTAAVQTNGVETITYEARYAAVPDLIRILAEQAPQVLATPGPSSGFTETAGAGGGSGGTSTSMGGGGASAGGAAGGGAAGGGAAGGGAQGGGGASMGAGGAAGGAGGSGSGHTSILILTGTSDAITAAEAVLSKVDIPRPMIRVEARVMDLNLDHTKSIGITWSFSQGFQFGEFTPAAAGAGGGGGNAGLPIFPFKTSGLGRDLLSAQVDLLANDSHNKVLASPTLMMAEDHPANVFIGDEIVYQDEVDKTINGTTIHTTTQNVGISLNTVGHVNPDNTISLNIAPTVSVLTGFAAGANGAQLPQIAQRSAQTTMRVANGQTIAIGGLIRDDDLTTMERVPILSDLPILGELFRHRQTTKNRSEVVIFLRATVVPVETAGVASGSLAPLPSSDGTPNPAS